MPPVVGTLEPNRPIAGRERIAVTEHCVRRYGAGDSIRSIASGLGRSYGFVHRILIEAGVTLRRRGGAMRKRRADTRLRGEQPRQESRSTAVVPVHQTVA
jgi:hypothetical protein